MLNCNENERERTTTKTNIDRNWPSRRCEMKEDSLSSQLIGSTPASFTVLISQNTRVPCCNGPLILPAASVVSRRAGVCRMINGHKNKSAEFSCSVLLRKLFAFLFANIK